MDVTFYDFDFNCLEIFPRPISVNIEKKYCGFGTAELHFAICEQEIINLLDENEYLFCKVGDNYAVISGWQIDTDIAVFGRTPEWLLTKKGVEPRSFADTSAEVVARTFVEETPDFVVLGELSGVGTAIDYSIEDVRTLYDVVCEVLSTQKLGFKVIPDIIAKQFVFTVYEGANTLCTLSSSYRTASDMKYSVEKQDATTNSGWYERRYKDMGEWNAVSNKPSLTNNIASNAYTFYKVSSDGEDERFGLSCVPGSYLYSDNSKGTWRISPTKPENIWLYIDNPQKSGLKKWDAVLKGAKTDEEAKSELGQMTFKINIDCETYQVEYGKDYSLGDIVRVQLEFGDFKKTQTKRVSAVNIYYDVDSSGIVPELTEE